MDESEAIQAIQRAGGRVERDETRPGSPVTGVDLFGAFDFGDREVHLLTMLKSLKRLRLLFCGNISDAGFLELTKLNLTELDLFAHPGLTEIGLHQLWSFQGLEELKLSGVNVTDATLKGIGGLQNLGRLDLRATKAVTDHGLKSLAGLKKLRKLGLNSTRVTDAGVFELKQLTTLTALDLSWTGITDAGLSHLAELKNLEQLDLARTQIGDAGVAELTPLANLVELYLHGTRITDAALSHLLSFNHLKNLSTYSTQVTNLALKEFRKQRPGVSVNGKMNEQGAASPPLDFDSDSSQ